MTSPAGQAPTSEAVVLERGQAIDRFVVLGLVGRGGMGEVYAAYDPELDRKVAIKLLRARGDAADGKTRLLREAQAIAKLQHPNVVVVYDVGTFRENVFIAMEFVEGRTVGGWLHAGARTRREIMEVYLAAGRGLAAAHAAGLVHRDFKPDNVMVTNDGQVRVMDFGLARQIGEGAEEARAGSSAPALPVSGADEVGDTFDPAYDPEATRNLRAGAPATPMSQSGKYLSVKLTQTGAMLGTPAYMAPEQFAVRETDARTDQFSFCVALYEGLYGERPFEGETFLALMTSVTTGAVSAPLPKARVPGWMRRVLLRGLSTEAERRFPSMAALLTALATDPTVRWRRLAIGVALLALVVAGVAATRRVGGARQAMCLGGGARWAGIWEPGGAPSPRKDAIHGTFVATGKSYAEAAFRGATKLLDAYVARWQAMYVDACEATHVRGEQSSEVLDLRMACLQERLVHVRALGDVLATADGTVVENAVSAAEALPTLEPCADVTTLRAVIKPPSDEVSRRRVEALRAEKAHFVALRDAGQCAAADKLAGSLIDEARKVGYLPLLAETLGAAAILSDTCSDLVLGIARYHEAFSTALAAHHDEVATEIATIVAGPLASRMGRLEEARVWVGIAHGMIARLGGRPILEAWTDMAEGSVLISEGHPQAALEAYERSLKTKERILGHDSVDVFISVGNSGIGYEVTGDYAKALDAYETARAGFARLLGDEHPKVAMELINVGEALNLLRRYGEGRAAYSRALDIYEKVSAAPFFLAYALTGMGIASIGAGDPSSAVPVLERALQIRERQPENLEQLGETRFALARALWVRRPAHARALALARQALADYGRVKGTVMPVPNIGEWLRAPSANL